ncbi:MAG: helix-turn-helix domain-containing protein [Candidatus Aminicenantia bacterium]
MAQCQLRIPQADLAEKVGLSPSTISQIESGVKHLLFWF